MDKSYRCQEVLPLFRHDAEETLKGVRFYLDTLEKFINDEKLNEISKLKKNTDKLAPDKQGEFWAWHYPVHWDQIFASQLSPNVAKAGGLQSQDVKGEAVIYYRNPLSTQDLKSSGFPEG